MLAQNKNISLLEKLQDPEQQKDILIDLYCQHIRNGAKPAVAIKFLERLEKIMCEDRPQDIHVHLGELKADFGDAGYFDQTLQDLGTEDDSLQ